MAPSVVVIGGGMVGTAIAFELQERGARTWLVERDGEPQGASASSFASLTAFGESQRDVYLLKCLGLAGWRAWTKRFGDDLDISWSGEIRWAETREDARKLTKAIDSAFARGYPVRAIGAEEIAERLPGSEPGAAIAGSYASEDGHVDPVKTIHILRKMFVDAGGSMLVGRASLLFDDATTQVRVGGETLTPDRVVVAAGAETGTLLERFGWEIPMAPSPGLLALTKPTYPMVEGTVYVTPTIGPAFHLRQSRDGSFLIGERTQDEVARDPSRRHAERLLHQARRSFPSLQEVDVDRFSVEWRPMPRDGMPIVGSLPGLPSVYLATAHSGVTLAPALASLVSHELLEGVPAPRLTMFRPSRFGQHEADAIASVEEAFDSPAEVFLG